MFKLGLDLESCHEERSQEERLLKGLNLGSTVKRLSWWLVVHRTLKTVKQASLQDNCQRKSSSAFLNPRIPSWRGAGV